MPGSKTMWDDAVDPLVTAIRAGHPTDGVAAAIEKCRAVLAVHFPPDTLNRDKLPNWLVEI